MPCFHIYISYNRGGRVCCQKQLGDGYTSGPAPVRLQSQQVKMLLIQLSIILIYLDHQGMHLWTEHEHPQQNGDQTAHPGCQSAHMQMGEGFPNKLDTDSPRRSVIHRAAY